MVSRFAYGVVGGCLALWMNSGAYAAMLDTDALMPAQTRALASFNLGPRELSSAWLARPSATSGGTDVRDMASWSALAMPPGPFDRPADSFDVEARFGFLTSNANPGAVQQEQPVSPVPLPPAVWELGSALLLLSAWLRRIGYRDFQRWLS